MARLHTRDNPGTLVTLRSGRAGSQGFSREGARCGCVVKRTRHNRVGTICSAKRACRVAPPALLPAVGESAVVTFGARLGGGPHSAIGARSRPFRRTSRAADRLPLRAGSDVNTTRVPRAAHSSDFGAEAARSSPRLPPPRAAIAETGVKRVPIRLEQPPEEHASQSETPAPRAPGPVLLSPLLRRLGVPAARAGAGDRGGDRRDAVLEDPRWLEATLRPHSVVRFANVASIRMLADARSASSASPCRSARSGLAARTALAPRQGARSRSAAGRAAP